MRWAAPTYPCVAAAAAAAQVLLQQATCDVSPARVLARVMAVLRPGLPPAGAPLRPADEAGLRRAVMAGGLFQLHADVAVRWCEGACGRTRAARAEGHTRGGRLRAGCGGAACPA